MTKLVSRIATGITILGLAAPAFAATSSRPMTAPAPAVQTSSVHHHRAHRKVASASEKKVKAKKVAKKKSSAKGAAKTENAAAPSATPAPTSK